MSSVNKVIGIIIFPGFSWPCRTKAWRSVFSSPNSFSHTAVFTPSSSAARRPWSVSQNAYVRYFCGVVGRLHLFSLGQEPSFFIIEGILSTDVVVFARTQVHNGLLLLSYLLFQLAYLIHYLV